MHFALGGKKARILAPVVTAFIIIFVVVNRDLYLGSEADLDYGFALYMVSIIAGVGAGALILIQTSASVRLRPLFNLLLFIAMPIFSFQMVEVFNGKYIWNYSFKTGLANYMIYLLLYLLIYFISGSFHVTGLIVNIFLYVWSLVNYFVELFRGTPFVPMDIAGIRTAMNVSDGYTYELSWNLILGTIVFLLVYLFNRRFTVKKRSGAKRRKAKAAAAAQGGTTAETIRGIAGEQAKQTETAVSGVTTQGAANAETIRENGVTQAQGVTITSGEKLEQAGAVPGESSEAEAGMEEDAEPIFSFFSLWKAGAAPEPDPETAERIETRQRKLRISGRIAAAAYVVVVCASFYGTDFCVNMGYKPDFWNQSRGYLKTGSFFNFALNTRYLFVTKPDSYSAENATEYLTALLEEYGVDPDSDTSTNILTGENDYTASEDGEYPNIIYIMNESWADLSLLGDLETNQDYMPFINSLTENTIKGYVTVPVFGAGTSNSEFEALTGHTTSFLPSGSNVYQLYINSEVPSLVSTLSSLGYSLTAFHPYYESGWNRVSVYNYLGFDDFISIEDIIDQDIIDTYKANADVEEYEELLAEAYPGEDILLRRFVSDSYDYETLIEMYENRDEEEPFFVFNVTMQNHGGYSASYTNFDQQIYTTNLSATYPKANRYLSLVYETDAAFEELIEYFSNVDEPTIICMFGDHYPSIEDEFYEELLGTSLEELTTEQELLRYSTPFVIWANYDIDEAEVGQISANYLSTLLSQAAGLPQTQYNKYLSVLYQELPIITTVGYVDSEGTVYDADEESEYTQLLNQYYTIEYNGLLDTEDMDTTLFYLDE